jgi:hypothetical protein
MVVFVVAKLYSFEFYSSFKLAARITLKISVAVLQFKVYAPYYLAP